MSGAVNTAVKYSVLGLLVVGVGYALYKKAGSTIANVVSTDLNPVSDQNLAYRAVSAGLNATVGAATGDTTDTLGTYVANLTDSLDTWVRMPDGSLQQVSKIDAFFHPSWIRTDAAGNPLTPTS